MAQEGGDPPPLFEDESPSIFENNVVYAWALVICVFLFFFFDLGPVAQNLVKKGKKSVQRVETEEEKMEKADRIRAARAKQQAAWDQMAAEAKEKQVKNSTAYKMSAKKRSERPSFGGDDSPSNYRPSPSSRYGRRGGG